MVEFCRILELLRLEKALRRSLPTWCRRTPRVVSFQPTSCPGILMLFPDFLGVDLAFAVLFLPPTPTPRHGHPRFLLVVTPSAISKPH